MRTARPASPTLRAPPPTRARPLPLPPRAAADAARHVSSHPDAVKRRAAAEARRLAALEDAKLAAKPLWYLTPGPPNVRLVSTPAALAAATASPRLVVTHFFCASCPGCRALLPKLHSIAANNPDVDFVKVNTDAPGMADAARDAGVDRLPSFALYLNAARVASFSITLARIGVLRAEIAANKPCVGECAVHEGGWQA